VLCWTEQAAASKLKMDEDIANACGHNAAAKFLPHLKANPHIATFVATAASNDSLVSTKMLGIENLLPLPFEDSHP
jgi:hypothetical protein